MDPKDETNFDKELYLRMNNRERAARKKAEALLEDKAYKLYMTNQKLQQKMEDLKVRQEQLIAAEKMAALGQISARIAHEINNPMAFIYSNLTYLKDCMEDIENEEKETKRNLNESELSEFINLISESLNGIRRVIAITKDVNSYSHKSMIFSRKNIHPIIEQTVLMTRKLVAKSEIKIKIMVPNNLSAIEFDANKIQQVLLNLLTNAVQSLAHEGEIIVRANEHKNDIRIDIADNGQGIPNKHLDKIFEPFFTTKLSGKGTGLGLYISKEIIRAHNGDIAVKTNNAGGSTFTITLPKPRIS